MFVYVKISYMLSRVFYKYFFCLCVRKKNGFGNPKPFFVDMKNSISRFGSA